MPTTASATGTVMRAASVYQGCGRVQEASPGASRERARLRLALLGASFHNATGGVHMERIELARDCEAVQIPFGHTVTLEKGTDVVITQSLGGSYTVQAAAYGGLFRIAGEDADALGKEPVAAPAEAAADAPDLEQQVWGVLRTCYDPEIPVNIVDLGLVYDLRITPEDAGQRVDVKMTLTAPGCGMGTSIAADARVKLLDLPGVTDADVQIVWDPPWNPQMISPEGKERLGMA